MNSKNEIQIDGDWLGSWLFTVTLDGSKDNAAESYLALQSTRLCIITLYQTGYHTLPDWVSHSTRLGITLYQTGYHTLPDYAVSCSLTAYQAGVLQSTRLRYYSLPDFPVSQSIRLCRIILPDCSIRLCSITVYQSCCIIALELSFIEKNNGFSQRSPPISGS